MRVHRVTGLIVSALALASCGGRRAVEIKPAAEVVASRWNGSLSTPPELAGVVSVSGQGWMAPDPKDPGKTQAHVAISNAVPNSVYPWHVHRGRCGSDQGILGPADAYPPLKVNGDGKASGDTELQLPFPRSGEFFVNVHASAKNMRTIVACGNLAPPSR